MALVVLDASVVIAFLDPDDTLHEAAVRALTERQHDELLLPTSAYAEILVAPHRRGAQAVAEVEAFLSDFSIRLEELTPAIAQAAAKLRSESRSLRLPDALMLATAAEIGAEVVLTGDESWGKISDNVTLIQRG